MKIVLDSGVIYRGDNKPLARRSLAKLFAYCHDNRIEIIIPSVVMAEVENKRLQAVRAFQADLKTLQKDYANFETAGTVLDLPAIDEVSEIASLRERLLSNTQQATVSLVANTAEDVETAVRRSLDGQKPASSADKGLRDTLIWFTVRAVFQAERGVVVFISANSNDFASKDKTTLHPDLELEIEGMRHNSEHVLKYYQSIESFLAVDETNDQRLLALAQEDLGLTAGEFSALMHREYNNRRGYRNYLDMGMIPGRSTLSPEDVKANTDRMDAEHLIIRREMADATIRLQRIEKEIIRLKAKLGQPYTPTFATAAEITARA